MAYSSEQKGCARGRLNLNPRICKPDRMLCRHSEKASLQPKNQHREVQ